MVLSFFVMGLGTLFFACNSAPSPAPAAAPSAIVSPATDLKKPGEAKIGDKTKCPVGGDEFVVTDTTPKADYEGKTYYFCCPPCAGKFKADPKKYLGAGT